MAKTNKSLELEKLVKDKGYRLTNPRKMVLNILAKTKEHLLAKEIYLKIHKKQPEIGLTTVYRTLEMLVKMGLINKFDFGESQSRYELAWNLKEHHHHLICQKCGRIIDYNDFIDQEVKFFDRIQEALSKKYQFDIQNHEVYFYGKCKPCKTDEQKEI